MPLTLAIARSTLWKYGSNVDFALATAPEKLLVDNILNQVQERFIHSGKPRLSLARARIVVYDSQITLPASLETVLKATPIFVNADSEEEGCGCARFGIYNGWHDISTDSIGNVDGGCIPGLVDMGEGFATFRDVDFGFDVRVAPRFTEPGTATMLFRGTDPAGEEVYTATSTQGVSVAINSVSPAESDASFSVLRSWVKSTTTNGIVDLIAVPITATGSETTIATIYPGELTSGYRRYAVPNLEDGSIVSCLCKRAYVPAVSDNDILIPSNLGAIKLAMMALQYEDKNDWDRSEQFWNKAYQLLELDRQEYDGDSALPTFNFAGDFGAGSIINVM